MLVPTLALPGWAGGGCPDPAGAMLGTGGSSGGSSTGPDGTTRSVAASMLEQLSLERINRARLRPGAEAAANGISVDEGIPAGLTSMSRPALALNAALNAAADRHSRDMLNRDFFAHNNPDGIDPFERMRRAGYTFIAAGENLAWKGTTGPLGEAQFVEDLHVSLFVDTGIAGRGHRVTMLSENFREVGIGIARGTFTQDGSSFDSIMQTQDFGATSANSTFVLGVVYSDANGNGQYDFGEGAASRTVTLGGVAKSTNAAGGYEFEVTEPGDYTLQFSGGPSQDLSIAFGGSNVKVDLVDGSRVVVNLGLGPIP